VCVPRVALGIKTLYEKLAGREDCVRTGMRIGGGIKRKRSGGFHARRSERLREGGGQEEPYSPRRLSHIISTQKTVFTTKGRWVPKIKGNGPAVERCPAGSSRKKGNEGIRDRLRLFARTAWKPTHVS